MVTNIWGVKGEASQGAGVGGPGGPLPPVTSDPCRTFTTDIAAFSCSADEGSKFNGTTDPPGPTAVWGLLKDDIPGADVSKAGRTCFELWVYEGAKHNGSTYDISEANVTRLSTPGDTTQKITGGTAQRTAYDAPFNAGYSYAAGGTGAMLSNAPYVWGGVAGGNIGGHKVRTPMNYTLTAANLTTIYNAVNADYATFPAAGVKHNLLLYVRRHGHTLPGEPHIPLYGKIWLLSAHVTCPGTPITAAVVTPPPTVCYKLVNCSDGQVVITGTDLKQFVGSVAVIAAGGITDEWIVSLSSTCVGAISVTPPVTTYTRCSLPCTDGTGAQPAAATTASASGCPVGTVSGGSIAWLAFDSNPPLANSSCLWQWRTSGPPARSLDVYLMDDGTYTVDLYLGGAAVQDVATYGASPLSGSSFYLNRVSGNLEGTATLTFNSAFSTCTTSGSATLTIG